MKSCGKLLMKGFANRACLDMHKPRTDIVSMDVQQCIYNNIVFGIKFIDHQRIEHIIYDQMRTYA